MSESPEELLQRQSGRSKQWLLDNFAEARRRIEASEDWCRNMVDEAERIYGPQPNMRARFDEAIQCARDNLTETQERLLSELDAVVSRIRSRPPSRDS